MADPNQVGQQQTDVQVPIEVQQAIARISTSPEDYQQRIAAWKAQQTALQQISQALPAFLRGNGGIQVDEYHWVDPSTRSVWVLSNDTSGKPHFTQMSDADSNRYIASVTGGTGIVGAGGGGGGGGGGSRLSTDDPRYWDLQYAQLDQATKQAADTLAYNYYNAGLDAESSRRQALATILASRNNLAANTAQTSADIAKQAAQFAANPRDTYAEALYRNQVGGSTPFGDINNQAFGDYGKALAQKAQDIFQPVAQDLNMARQYRDAIPPLDFLSADQRAQLTAPSPAPAPAQGQYYGFNSPEEAAAMQKYFAAQKPPGYAMGGQIDFGNMTRFGGYQPSSSEGTTNLNVHEPAFVVGKSGHVYATLAENGYPEQLIIKPTASGAKAAKEAEKAKAEGMKAFAGGGTVNAQPSIDEMNAQYSKLLERLGGQGGGSSTPFGGARFLAGAPYEALQNDPFLRGITEATYSMKGIDPAELWAQVQRFQVPGVQNNIPRVSFA